MCEEYATRTGAGSKSVSREMNALDSHGLDLMALDVEVLGGGHSEEARRIQQDTK